jgi:hypothetical protein
MGFGSSTLRWQRQPMWSKRMAAFLRGKGQILCGFLFLPEVVTNDHSVLWVREVEADLLC